MRLLCLVGATLLVSAVTTATVWAQHSGVRLSPGEVKQDTDWNKAGAPRPTDPSSRYLRVPTQPGKVQQDTDWNAPSRSPEPKKSPPKGRSSQPAGEPKLPK